jgi:aspartate aminotransferase
MLYRMTSSRLSTLAASLVGSEILKIAADVRSLVAQGREICNLTVGDFAPSEFRIPARLEEGIVDALRAGETNYPPSDGTLPLREAVRALYGRSLGFTPDLAQVIVTGGSRPGIYAAYRSIVTPGDRVVYPTPSWNNNHYVHLVGATGVPIATEAATRACSRSARRRIPPERCSALTSCAASARSSWRKTPVAVRRSVRCTCCMTRCTGR